VWSQILLVLLLGLMCILATAVVSAILLGLGTGLSRLFAVSVWEGTVVATLVGAAVIWFVRSARPVDEIDLDELEEPPQVVLRVPTPSSGKRRQR
jgi:hypothetical protein